MLKKPNFSQGSVPLGLRRDLSIVFYLMEKLSIPFLLLGLSLGASAEAQTVPGISPSGSGTNVVVVPLDLTPAADEMFRQGIDLQSQKQYARAAQILGDLIQFHPTDSRVEEALYRLAECHRALGRFQDAIGFLHLQRDQFPKSKWRAAGCLVEGEMLTADKKWAEARPLLDEASRAKETPIRVRAFFLLAIAAEQLGKPTDAQPALETLVKITKENPYLEYSQLRLARLLIDAGQTERAASLLKQVLSSTQDPQLRAEAAVRAGNLAYGQKQYRDAVGFYEVVRRIDSPDFWKRLAHLGLLQANFALADYPAATALYQDVQPTFPAQTLPQVYFLAAESYRLQKKYPEALALYERIAQDFPSNAVSEPSAWGRLLILQTTGDSRFVDAVPSFLKTFPQSPRLPYVRLMQADNAYLAKSYTQARSIYADIIDLPEISKLPDEVFSGILIRWGRAAFILKEYSAADEVFSNFLRRFPKHASVPDILWMRLQSQQALNKTDEAFFTANELLDRYKDYPSREAVLWQGALLAGNKKEYSLMVKRLAELTEKYPQTKFMPEAQYWLGFSLIQIKQPRDAISHFRQARLLNPTTYFESTTQSLIRIALDAQDLPTLIDEVASYEKWQKGSPNSAPVSLDVLEWIAQQLGTSPAPAKAEPYYRKTLILTKDPVQKKRTQLALSLLMSKISNWGAAIEEWNKYIKLNSEEANRSAVLEPLAQAYIGAAKFDEAENLAEQILRQNPEGEYNARGRLLLGDIAFGKHQYSEAAKIYSAVALLIDDPLLTPLAKSKAEESRKRLAATPPLPNKS